MPAGGLNSEAIVKFVAHFSVMKSVLVLVFSNLKHDARVMRQIGFLKKNYRVTVVCMGIHPTDEYSVILLPEFKLGLIQKAISAGLLLLRMYEWAYRVLYPYQNSLKKQFEGRHFDLIVANDVETVPLAFELAGPETKILFDAHEYAPRHFEDKLWWRVFFMGFNTYICKKYIPKVAGMLTIAQSLADEYERNFRVKPVVITNAGPFKDLKVEPTDNATIKLVHHGIVNRSRRIELIIGMMKFLPAHFTLDLILVLTVTSSQSTHQYLQELKDLAASDPRIKFRDPLPIEKIVPALQGFDMGIILAPPINFNYSNGLPNKLFDYIQARIGVVTGPTPEIARIVNGYKVGVVADGFTPASLAEKLAPLRREDVLNFKENSHRSAPDLCAEKNEVIFDECVRTILKR